MALIGQIAISMTTDARQFKAGLAQAAASMRAFQKSAAVDIKGGKVLMKSGLADIANGMQAVGILSANAMKLMASASVKAGRKVIDSLGPIKGAALASAEALRYTYGGAARMVGGAIGAGLSKAGGPIAAAAKASAASLDYVYGPAVRAIGSGLSRAFQTATTAMTPLAGSLVVVSMGLGKVAAGAALAGRGLLKLGVLGAIQGFHALTGAVGRMVGVVREAINTLGRFAAVAGVVAAAALWHVAKGAIALGEQTDRARIVFGEYADTVIAQSKLMATAFGVSRAEFVQAASAFGTIFEGVGYAKKDAADLSVHFVKLATDLSSLVHIPVAEAMEKIQSGLAGQVRPLREVGVFMSEEGIAAKAAAMGLAKVGTELTEQQKVQARIAFITEHLSIATGNLGATAGSTGNMVRSLAGRFQNLSDTAGTALNAVLGPALDELNVGIQALQMAWDASALAASSASVGVLGGAQEQVHAIGMLQQSVGFVADAWQAVGLAFLAVQTKVTEGLIFMVENLNGFAAGIGDVISYFTGLKYATSDFTKTWLEDLKRMQQVQQETFQAKLAAPAASEGINAAFAASRAKIEAARKELAKPSIDVTKLKPTPEAAKLGKEVKFASAMSRGSSEAASTILRSRYSGGRTADEQKKQTGLQTKMATSLDKIAAAVVGGQAAMFLENF